MKRAATTVLLLLLGACSPSADEEASPTPVALVALAPATRGLVDQRVTLYGVAEAGAAGRITLTAPAEATVARIVAPAGTRVAAGQVVAELSATPNTRLEIVKASADARAADAAYARARRLRGDGLVADAEVESARAAAASADATQASLARRAGALTLRASAAGFIDTVPVAPGDLVQAGAAVATVARPGDLRGRFGVDPTVARSLRPGAPVTVTGSAARAPLTVRIDSIAPTVDPTTRLVPMFVRLPAAARIAVGETLTAEAAVAMSRADAVTIPYAAVLDDAGQPYVFVVSAGVAHRRDVALGAAQGDRIAVDHGLAVGDKVVTEGATAVEDGAKVRTE